MNQANDNSHFLQNNSVGFLSPQQNRTGQYFRANNERSFQTQQPFKKPGSPMSPSYKVEFNRNSAPNQMMTSPTNPENNPNFLSVEE